MMGSKTDKFMSGKGTEQIFRALWLLQAFSKSAVVFFSFFFQYLSSFIFRFSLGRNLSLIFVNPYPIPLFILLVCLYQNFILEEDYYSINNKAKKGRRYATNRAGDHHGHHHRE